MSTLLQLSRDLTLSEKEHNSAARIYKEVSGHLQIKLNGYQPDIFPQGSFRLGTVIRPIANDTHDLDFVCLLNANWHGLEPRKLKSLVGLSLAGINCNKIEEKDRCWRLHYSDFHVDVLPAIPERDAKDIYKEVRDSRYVEAPIRIPEKGLQNFKSSNPRGYAQWFLDQGSKQFVRNSLVLDEKSVEALPPFRSNPDVLQQAVMLIKRHRDHMFCDKLDVKPISIIISTLAAESYSGELDALSALKGIVSKMPDRVTSKKIPNPVNPRENFADKWVGEPQKQSAFNQWLGKISDMVDGLMVIRNNNRGIVEMQKVLDSNYGNDARQALLNHETAVSFQRANQTLKVSGSGIIGSVGYGVKSNTFYGE